MSKKLPAMQFYPGDWMKDPGLRSVSSAARGLWIDMLCLMWESRRRGYLEIGTGRPVTPELLARMTGNSLDETAAMLQELLHSGVYSQSEHGLIHSRRMVKDERIRNARKEAGKAGGEKRRPDLLKQKSKQKPSKPLSKTQAKKGSSVSSSISTSSSPSVEEKPPDPLAEFDFGEVRFPDGMDCPAVRSAIEDWMRHKHSRKEGYKNPSDQISRLLRQSRFLGDPRVFCDAVDHSIEQDWQGCYTDGSEKTATPSVPPANGRPQHKTIEELVREKEQAREQQRM